MIVIVWSGYRVPREGGKVRKIYYINKMKVRQNKVKEIQVI